MALLVVLYDSSTGLYKTQKVGSAQIADGAVVSAKIGANVIATPHIANQGILSASIGAGIVGTPHLANQAITSAKIAANAIGGPHILDGSILGADLANQAVVSAKIGALAVGAPHLAALSIVSGKVASGGLAPLTSGKIWAGFTGNMPREEDKPAGATLSLSGLTSNRPVAGAVIEDTLYYEIDTILTYKIVAGAWVLQSITDPWSLANATLADFQANAATGDLTSPLYVNDNNTATIAYGTATNKYAEIDFGKWVKINQWRMYGNNANVGDGRWKIQYYGTDLVYHDWKTGIVANKSVWSAMDVITEVTCKKVKLIVTTLDSQAQNDVRELEVYHS